MAWIFLYILCWGSFVGVAHSYLFYPLLLRLLAKGKRERPPFIDRKDQDALPRVSILMSAYNEEKVLSEKLKSIENLDYPFEKVRLYAGSDHSTDQTDAILSEYARRHSWVAFFPSGQRRGKPAVINTLAAQAASDWGSGQDHILLITDANVLFSQETVYRLARHFCDPRMAVVDSHILPTGLKKEGISKAENRYISMEVWLKHWEGCIWGAMIGPFGGCYAIRSDYFSPVPANFLVDDFYVVLRALEKGGKAINDLEARCYEGASHTIETEFRRKRRIGAGNFQNMQVFRHLWWPPFSGLSFAFFSHKVLRWVSPHLMLLGTTATFFLALWGNQLYQVLFILLGAGFLGIPALDLVLKQIGIQVIPLRGIRYFIIMNLALFAGWIHYLKGIQSNVWQPTQRN